MHADELMRPLFDHLMEQLGDVPLFDAHTHIGANDPDGFRCEVDELVGALEDARARGVVFPMHEPDGYREANDAVIAAAEASGGRLVAFCRLDPRADPVAEAERALAAGARGIKLHPRAEEFSLHDDEVEPILSLADERRLPVLVHAGRGIPALGRDSLGLTERFGGMRLILAHAAISDLAWLWEHVADHPNLFVDTSWWSPADLLALFALVPPGQILWASDAPYGTPVQAAILTARCALQAGLDSEQLRWVMGGQVERLLAGDEPVDAGAAPGRERLESDVLLERVQSYLISAVGRLMAGDAAAETLELARLAAAVPPGAAQHDVCASILDLLDRHREYVERRAGGDSAPGDAVEGDQYPREPRFPGIHLLIVAACLARTPDVPVPEAGSSRSSQISATPTQGV